MRNDEILKRAEEGMKESNKILIRELVRDLEEKGISPVIAVDGEVQKLTKLRGVNQSELTNFEQELKNFGFEKSDFCLLEGNTTKPTLKSIFRLNKNIILVHKKSAKIKKYNNSHWIADFHHDLKNEFFTS